MFATCAEKDISIENPLSKKAVIPQCCSGARPLSVFATKADSIFDERSRIEYWETYPQTYMLVI